MFSNINEYQYLYIALKNHYLSLKVNSSNIEEEYSEPSTNTEDDNSLNLKIKPEVLPDDINLYGSEFLKGKWND